MNLRKELRIYSTLAFIMSLYNTVDQHLTKLVAYASVALFIFITNNPLSPKFIVFALGYYSVLCLSVGFHINKAINLLYTSHVAIKRVQVSGITSRLRVQTIV